MHRRARVALFAGCVTLLNGCSAVYDASTTSVVTPASSTTTAPSSLQFAAAACGTLTEQATRDYGRAPTKPVACEAGWSNVSTIGAEGLAVVAMYQIDQGVWRKRAERPQNETYPIAELVSYGMPTATAQLVGVDRPWITTDNQVAVTRLLSANQDFHDAIKDPCSLVTVMQLDLATKDYAYVTDSSDECVMVAPRTVIVAKNATTVLKATMRADESPVDSISARLFKRTISEYDGVESTDILICGDPVGQDLCVTQVRQTPVERRP